MKVYANMVVFNEENRYLDACLSWIKDSVDGIFCYDDGSTDATVSICEKHGAVVQTRPQDVPSFIAAEGTFREAGWRAMVEALGVEHGDWILGIDADDFPVPRGGLKRLAAKAASQSNGSINIRYIEMRTIEPPTHRVDGEWGKIVQTRMAKYRGGADQGFRTSKMGSGVFPWYAYVCQNWGENKECGVRWLHYGHANAQDRREKYDRYTSILDNGHANHHIQSIIAKNVTTADWTGGTPEIWRGVRV